MEYIYSALLLHSVNQPITAENVTKIIQATGAAPDESKVKAMVAALDGVDIEEALSKAAMPIAATPAGEAGADKKEEKDEEGEEERAEKAVEGLAGLFG